MKPQAMVFAGVFVLLVLLVGARWPKVAVGLMAVVLLSLTITRWPQIQALLYGSSVPAGAAGVDRSSGGYRTS